MNGFDRVWAIADEDLERENEQKTSAVHFLRFEFDQEMIAAAKQGADFHIGIDHPNCQFSVEPIPHNIRDSLANDLQPVKH